MWTTVWNSLIAPEAMTNIDFILRFDAHKKQLSLLVK